MLLLDRFDDLPVLVAANPAADDPTRAGGYRVAVVDKQTGKLRHHQTYTPNGVFQGVVTDPRTRAVEFWRHDLRVRIVPDEDGRP